MFPILQNNNLLNPKQSLAKCSLNRLYITRTNQILLRNSFLREFFWKAEFFPSNACVTFLSRKTYFYLLQHWIKRGQNSYWEVCACAHSPFVGTWSGSSPFPWSLSPLQPMVLPGHDKPFRKAFDESKNVFVDFLFWVFSRNFAFSGQGSQRVDFLELAHFA